MGLLTRENNDSGINHLINNTDKFYIFESLIIAINYNLNNMKGLNKQF